MTDDRLNHLLSVLPDRSFLLLEDIDALFNEQRQTNTAHQSRITFSGLLNALDGVGSSEERIVFMTTNHYAKIDAALLRPGRVDVVHYLGLATSDQIYRMFVQFYPGFQHLAPEFANKIPANSVSPARVQGHFILCKNDPMEAIDKVGLLLS
jgi:mitochondrial chaperone BCS1